MITPADRLERYVNNEKKAAAPFEEYSLKGITETLAALGNPHRQFRSVHIAGTNGKGSVCHALAEIFMESGLCTGLYTSPHLLSLHERIRINGREISDKELIRYFDKIESVCRNVTLTYFDMLTAAAFLHFADAGTDIAVIETGLGGRLDSTNVITPALSLITDISMDHTHLLGGDISQIAAEKAGII
ncbi:MAG: bifunctional folylpolyglutamate synthase/dihydrofolate synthase, partial [Spirochaetota bacterium]